MPYVLATAATLLFVNAMAPYHLSRAKRLIYKVVVGLVLTVGIGWYWLTTGDKPDETLFRLALCPFIPSAEKCKQNSEETTEAERARRQEPISPTTTSGPSPATVPRVGSPPETRQSGREALIPPTAPVLPSGQRCRDGDAAYRTSRPYQDAQAFGIVKRQTVKIDDASLPDLLASCKQALSEGNRAEVARLMYYLSSLAWARNPRVDRPDIRSIVDGFAKAADAGSVLAAWDAGDLYWRGPQVIKSIERAKHYYKLAADTGFAPAMIHLGTLHQQLTPSSRPNLAQGCDWYEKAANKGSIMGQYLFGTCLVTGEGRDRNFTSGIAMLLKAASRGMPAAQGLLGAALCEAPPPTGNRNECERWLRLAAKNGDDVAIDLMKKIGLRP